MELLFKGNGWNATRESAELPDGRVNTADIIHRPDTVHIIAITEPGRVLILREFRAFYGEYVWMIPSGKADKEQDMYVAAQRELREETGYEARQLELLSTMNQIDTLDYSLHVFIARDLVKNPLPQESTELIEVHELPIEEALEKVLTSPKTHLISSYALLRYMREHSLSL